MFCSYGGIFEKGPREYTLDDFYSLQLDKLDRYTCLKASEITIAEGDEESSSDEDDEDDEEEEDDETVDDRDETESVTVVGEDEEKAVDVLETIEEEKVSAIRPNSLICTAHLYAYRILFVYKRLRLWVSQRTQRGPPRTWSAHRYRARPSRCSMLDLVSLPFPLTYIPPLTGRILGEYWAQKAYGTTSSDSRGKQLRRDGFSLAEERYGMCLSRNISHCMRSRLFYVAEYKPVLEEVERILAEAGLDEEEMRKGAAAGPQGASGQSRNRR